MKITTFEQISLINQFKILEKLYPKKSSIYKPLRVNLEQGFDCGMSNIQQWLQSDKSQEIYTLVLEILKMYVHLISSYQNLENKSTFNKNNLLFQGFNKNHEMQYLICTNYMISEMKEFHIIDQNKRHKDFTSHKIMSAKYFSMLDKWKVFKNKHFLTYEEIQSILAK
ncbi:YfbU family protein [Priestia megaterium]|uniref:YfbU family protein n=1 Tax=Priestia megaterium TaxID=1404 RepID=UPI002E244A11|nr:YfbU family protein [Priestia megaterium]